MLQTNKFESVILLVVARRANYSLHTIRSLEVSFNFAQFPVKISIQFYPLLLKLEIEFYLESFIHKQTEA
jgi:hypothetical protein